jgi:hypothetical protein
MTIYPFNCYFAAPVHWPDCSVSNQSVGSPIEKVSVGADDNQTDSSSAMHQAVNLEIGFYQTDSIFQMNLRPNPNENDPRYGRLTNAYRRVFERTYNVSPTIAGVA